jgi:hypothetical protein
LDITSAQRTDYKRKAALMAHLAQGKRRKISQWLTRQTGLTNKKINARMQAAPCMGGRWWRNGAQRDAERGAAKRAG